MVCPKCGSPTSGDDKTCSNCGADLDKKVGGLDVKSEGLRKMTQELKAVSGTPQKFPAGERIADRFEIEELVEKGPFGEVYRASDEIVETEVALKVFDEEVVRTPPEREQFLTATRAARAMSQRNVVRIHDSGVFEGHPWVSMQYLEGLTLRKALKLREKKGERFTLEELEPVVTQITMALQHIGREFPDGNLKPTNIFFLPDLLKVTDGYILSALPGDIFTERLEDCDYLAPELHTSVDDADVRCDVYSLGTIIGEMYFGPDYQPGSDTMTDPEDSAIDALIRRATAFDPAERYASVEALSEDFSTLVDTGQLLDQGPQTSGPMPDVPGGESAELGAPGSAAMDDFPEDEIATRDYQRDFQEGSGKQPPPEPMAGPTNEVDRSQEASGPDLPPEPTTPADEADESLEETIEADRSVEQSAEATARPDEAKSSESDDSKSDVAPHKVISIIVGVLAVLGVVIFLLMPSETNHDVVPISGNDTGQQEDATKMAAADEADAGDAGEADTGLSEEKWAEVLGEARPALVDALAAADEKAEEKGKELEEEKEKEKEAQANRGGGSGGSGSSANQGSAAGRSGGGGGNKPEPATGTDCPSGMALVEKSSGNYCIDRFEFPGRGQRPKTNASWFAAQKACKGQGKRLCTIAEWRRACGSKYPYGSSWDASKCNTQDDVGFARSLTTAGKFKECRSWSGAYDMVGNAHEWVKEQKIVGGGFDSGPDVATCRYSSPKAPGSSSGNIGFRCCARPD